MALQPVSNKKAQFVIAAFIAVQIFIVFVVWIVFFGPSEREDRIKAALALAKAADLETAITSYHNDHKALPSGNDALLQASKAGKPYFTSFEERGDPSYKMVVANGVITLIFSPSQSAIGGKSLVLTPRISDGKFNWSCDASALEARYRQSKPQEQILKTGNPQNITDMQKAFIPSPTQPLSQLCLLGWKTWLSNTDQPISILPHDQTFDVEIILDLSNVSLAGESQLYFTIKLYAKRMGDGCRNLVNETQSTVPNSNMVTLAVRDTAFTRTVPARDIRDSHPVQK